MVIKVYKKVFRSKKIFFKKNDATVNRIPYQNPPPAVPNALQSTFRTKNRLYRTLPCQMHCKAHSVRKTAFYRTNRNANRIPYQKPPPAVQTATQTAFRTRIRLIPYQPRRTPLKCIHKTRASPGTYLLAEHKKRAG